MRVAGAVADDEQGRTEGVDENELGCTRTDNLQKAEDALKVRTFQDIDLARIKH
jgi:hypothetical protein